MRRKKAAILLSAVLMIGSISPMAALKVQAAETEQVVEAEAVVRDVNEAAIEALVERMYTKVLDRTSDPVGAAYWKENLIQGTKDGANLGYGFVMSDEYVNAAHDNRTFIRTLYITFLDREPAEAEIASWNDAIWSSPYANPRANVLYGFIMSKEFTAICDSYGILRGYMSPEGVAADPGIGQFVQRLYKVALGRDGESAGMNDWTQRIASKEWEAEDVATQGFLHSKEFLDKKLGNADFVEVLYGTFFGRPSDATGKNNWINALKSGMSRDDVIMNFARSEEFGNILHSYGLEPKPMPVVYPGPVIENTESWATIEADVTLRGYGSGYHAKLIIGNATSAVSFGIQYDVAASNGHANRAMCMIENVESNAPGDQTYLWPNDVEVELGKPAHLMLTMNKDGSGSVYVNYVKIGDYQNYNLANQKLYLRVEGSARLEGDQINADFENIKLKLEDDYNEKYYWSCTEFRTNQTMIATIKDFHTINVQGYITGIGGADWDSAYGGVSSVVQFSPQYRYY